MSATASTAVNPIALRQDEGEALWFLGLLATIKASRETTEGRVAVIEHLAPQGGGGGRVWHRDSRPARHSFLNSGRRAPGAPVRRLGALRRLPLRSRFSCDGGPTAPVCGRDR